MLTIIITNARPIIVFNRGYLFEKGPPFIIFLSLHFPTIQHTIILNNEPTQITIAFNKTFPRLVLTAK